MNDNTWIPSERGYMIDDFCRSYGRISANEGWFRQSWLGVTIWQMPEDLLRLQALIHTVRPHWIIETGTKFGGSAIFFASLLELNGEIGGGVLTVDLQLYSEARHCFATHPLGRRICAAIEGDAADPAVIAQFSTHIATDPGTVLVFLDDNHNANHVERELWGYSPLVTTDSYLIVADTVFADLAGTPVGQPTEKYPDVQQSNPRVAIARFLNTCQLFKRVEPPFPYGPSNFLDGFLQRCQ